ncbi:hypothetical protein ACHAO9_004800 [Fusarium lateritium]
MKSSHYTPEERARLREGVDKVADDFLQRIDRLDFGPSNDFFSNGAISADRDQEIRARQAAFNVSGLSVPAPAPRRRVAFDLPGQSARAPNPRSLDEETQARQAAFNVSGLSIQAPAPRKRVTFDLSGLSSQGSSHPRSSSSRTHGSSSSRSRVTQRHDTTDELEMNCPYDVYYEQEEHDVETKKLVRAFADEREKLIKAKGHFQNQLRELDQRLIHANNKRDLLLQEVDAKRRRPNGAGADEALARYRAHEMERQNIYAFRESIKSELGRITQMLS